MDGSESDLTRADESNPPAALSVTKAKSSCAGRARHNSAAGAAASLREGLRFGVWRRKARERAAALFQTGGDDHLAFRFRGDPGVAAMFYLAIASWPLGEVDRAISIIDRMQPQIADLTHIKQDQRRIVAVYGASTAALLEA